MLQDIDGLHGPALAGKPGSDALAASGIKDAHETGPTVSAASVAQSWVSGASVGIPGFAVEIKNNCNAIYEIGLYASAVFAYPATLTQRTLGCLSGAAVLFLVNLLRVLSLIGIGRYFPGGFQIAHLYLWQALFLALVAPAGLSGLAGFADSLKATWRGVLLRAGGAFLILALLWVVLAPAYAHLLAAFASPLIPSIESSPGTRYRVEGTTIVAERPIMRQTAETVTVSRTLLRETSGDYPLALLAALVLATPAWSLTRRGRVFAVTVCARHDTERAG